jgi:hypothetical protein
MLIPDSLKAQLPPWRSQEIIPDALKLCQAKLMTITGERTLYLIEGSRLDDRGWLFMTFGYGPEAGWAFGSWTETELKEFRDATNNGFILDVNFKPVLVRDVPGSQGALHD